jgi:ribosome-binding factor A
MSSRRVLKVAEAIREVVSMAILTELRDPRVRDVTVTYVEVSGDLRQAKVHVSVMGGEAKQNLTLRGLQNAAGFLQQKVAHRIETRYTPRLTFFLDQGVKHSIEVSRLLSELLPAEHEAGEDTVSEDTVTEDAVNEDAVNEDAVNEDAVNENAFGEDTHGEVAGDEQASHGRTRDEEPSDEEPLDEAERN